MGLLSVLLVAAGLSLAPASPASAALRNPIPVDSSGLPSYDFVSSDALFVFVTSDIRGGTVCIVPEDGGAGCSSPAWGTPNFIVGIGSVIQPIQAPFLRVGTWRLATEDSEGNPLDVSEPFTVRPCENCSREIGLQAIRPWKTAAEQNRRASNVSCAVGKVKGLTAGKEALGQPTQSKVLTVDEKGDVKADWSASGLTLVSASWSPLAPSVVSFDLVDPLEIGQGIALEILADLTCAVGKMYDDIANDPPDPNYETVAEPVFGNVDPLVSEEATALAESLARHVGLADASLTAFERYLGATEAGDDSARASQAQAAADITFDLIAEIRTTARALREFGEYADGVDVLAVPVAIDADEISGLSELFSRVRTSGFSSDEIAQLQTIGLSGPEIDLLRTNFSPDPGLLRPGATISDYYDELAETLEASIPDLDAFAREASAVAAGIQLDLDKVNATFDASPNPVLVGDVVQFTDGTAQSNSVTSWTWDFGDGASSTQQNPTHTYGAPGVYDVDLVVQFADGRTSSASSSIDVIAPPTAVASADPADAVGPVTVTFDGSGSTDPDGSLVSYDWDFGDGSTGTGPVVSHEYGSTGTYRVRLTVTDDDGLEASDEVTVRVRDASPVADFVPSKVVNVASLVGGASIVAASSGEARAAIDGASSAWATEAADTQRQFVVALAGERPHVIDQIRVTGSDLPAAVRAFRVDASSTGVEESDFAEILVGEAPRDNSGRAFDVPDTPARYLRFTVTDTWSATSGALVRDVQALTRDRDGGVVSLLEGPPGLGARVVAVSSGATSADRALDYSDTTPWTTDAGSGDEQVLTFELAGTAPATVTHMQFRPGVSSLRPGRVQLRLSQSSDPGTFRTVLDAPVIADGTVDFVLPPTVARFGQLVISGGTGSRMSVPLLRLFGAERGGAEVAFDDVSIAGSTPVESWSWDFGDGTTSTEQHPTHTYPAPGTYPVTLTVTDESGTTSSFTREYEVLAAPMVDFAPRNPPVAEGSRETFDGALADETLSVPVAWEWSTADETRTGNPASLLFRDSGRQSVGVTVVDSNLLSANLVKTIDVDNVPPTASSGPLTSPLPWGAPAVFGSGRDLSRTDQESLTCAWDFGNGDTLGPRPCDSSREDYSYPEPGLFTQTVTVTDKDGASASASYEVDVKPVFPRIALAARPSEDPAFIEVAGQVFSSATGLPAAELALAVSIPPTVGADVTSGPDGRFSALLERPVGPGPVRVQADFGGSVLYYPASATAQVTESVLPALDLVFSFDTSGSMGDDIAEVQQRVGDVVGSLDGEVDYRLGVVEMDGRVVTRNEDGTTYTSPLLLPLTGDSERFAEVVGSLRASGGEEYGFAATTAAMSEPMGFVWDDAAVCYVMITDDQDVGSPGVTREDAVRALQSRNATFFGVVNPQVRQTAAEYGPDPGSLAAETRGLVFDILDFRQDAGPVIDAILESCIERAINSAPTAQPQTLQAPTGTSVQVTLRGDDIDGDTLDYVIRDEPQNGTLSGDPPTLTYVPDESFVGVDTFTFVVDDGLAESPEAEVTIEVVAPQNEPPVAVGDAYAVGEDEVLQVPAEQGVLGNDADPEGGPLTALPGTDPGKGTLTLGTDGSLTYTPDQDVCGTDTATYTAADPDGGTSAPATITLEITCANDPPVAVDDAAEGVAGETIIVDVLANDSDLDGDPLVIQAVQGASDRVAAQAENGTIAVTTDPTLTGEVALTYTACDDQDACVDATLTLTVAGLQVALAQAVCVDDVAYLDYQLDVPASLAQATVTIAWADADGTVVASLPDQPLDGRTLWPGMVLDGSGQPQDWPGWSKTDDDTWVEDPDDLGATLRPEATVTFTVNPSVTVNAGYPPATENCAAQPPANDDPAEQTPPADDRPVDDVPADDPPADDLPAGDQPPSETVDLTPPTDAQPEHSRKTAHTATPAPPSTPAGTTPPAAPPIDTTTSQTAPATTPLKQALPATGPTGLLILLAISSGALLLGATMRLAARRRA